MYRVWDATSVFSVVYFLVLAVVGALLMMNLLLAATKVRARGSSARPRPRDTAAG